MIEEGALSDNILPSSPKEVEEKEDDLTLKEIPSRHNQPLTTRIHQTMVGVTLLSLKQIPMEQSFSKRQSKHIKS